MSALYLKGKALHTGSERYELTLVYDDEAKAEIHRVAQVGEIVADTVHLVWTRRVGEDWRRYTNGVNGSRAEGNQKVMAVGGAVGQRRSRQIYTKELGNMTGWAGRLPGLRNAIEEAELNLPK